MTSILKPRSQSWLEVPWCKASGADSQTQKARLTCRMPCRPPPWRMVLNFRIKAQAETTALERCGPLNQDSRIETPKKVDGMAAQLNKLLVRPALEHLEHTVCSMCLKHLNNRKPTFKTVRWWIGYKITIRLLISHQIISIQNLAKKKHLELLNNWLTQLRPHRTARPKAKDYMSHQLQTSLIWQLQMRMKDHHQRSLNPTHKCKARPQIHRHISCHLAFQGRQ